MAQYKHAFTPCPVVQSIIISISAAAAATVADVVRLSLHQYRPSFTHPYSPILLNSLSLSPSIPSPDRWHEHCVYNCCPSIMHSRQESCPTKRPLSSLHCRHSRTAQHVCNHYTGVLHAGGRIYTNSTSSITIY